MSATINYSVSGEIFQRYPGYRRGVVIAHALRNGPSGNELTGHLRAAEKRLRTQLDPAVVAEHSRIAPWRDAFRAFGAKPSSFRPSVEALARRAAKGDELPTISALVDIGTIASLENLMPIGAHALDEVTGDIELRFASGHERFIPFGSDEPETPPPGEVILAEGQTVLTRRWVWRQANHTIVEPATQSAVINVDALAIIDDTDIRTAMTQVQDLLHTYCGDRGEATVLTAKEPSVRIAIPR